MSNIKCKAMLKRVLFPRDRDPNYGEFQIVSMVLAEPNERIQLNDWGNFVIKGNLPVLKYNEEYEIEVKEEMTNRGVHYNSIMFGSMYKFKDELEINKYLKQILTEKQYNTITHNINSLENVFVNGDVGELESIRGIGKKTVGSLIDKFNSNLIFAEMYIQMSEFNLSKRVVDNLIKKYGSANVLANKLKSDPYVLMEDVDGFGFKRADDIALKVGIESTSKLRVKAFIYHLLQEQANDGHSYIDRNTLLSGVRDNLNDVPSALVRECLEELTNEQGKRKIKTDKSMSKFALESNYKLEESICENLIRLMSVNANVSVDDWTERISKLEQSQGWQYTDEQIDSVRAMIENNVIIVAAPGGTGKTAGIKAFISTLENNVEYAQCALSGRAGVNISQATGIEGHTIHRLLGYNPDANGFLYNEYNQLSYDVVVLDELSMVDARMFLNLIKAMKTGSKLIMLGDESQLESIGVGNVMYDMINSSIIKVCRYTKIHRQAERSAIKTESFKVRESKQIVDVDFSGTEIRGELQDLELVGYKDKTVKNEGELKPTVKLVVDKYKEIYNSGMDIMDIAAILPTKERGSSCYLVNQLIQDIVLSPSQRVNGLDFKQKSNYPYTIYVGDKVMNEHNFKATSPCEKDKKISVYNGNVGIVKKIDGRSMVVNFEGIGEILIGGEELNNIILGYAATSHKYQGSQVDYVITGLDYSHYTMLCREWVYTAMTRAKKYCAIIFETKALRTAIATTNIKDKKTFLKGLLRKHIK